MTAGQRVARLPFQVLSSVYVLMLYAQPTLMGLFLGGDFDRLADHALVGGLAAGTALFLAGASVLAWRPGGLPGGVVVASGMLFVATGVQVGAGYSRNLGLHVPMGVTLAAGGLALAYQAWRPRPAPAPPAVRAR
ncbi:MAG TPA: hypothetical protein VKA65_14660 [Acidimicrobiales bacterium]|nr:hypothetical protein [Acidimicrobiales bacterium]